MKKMMIMVMFLAGALSATIARAAEPVHYLEWDETNRMFVDAVRTDYEVVTADTYWYKADTWYVVNSTVDRGGIWVDNNVKIILCDGAKLTVNGGVYIDNYKNLTIYGQKEGTGVLEATGAMGKAGIGGSGIGLVINGGIIRAKGGNGNDPYNYSTYWERTVREGPGAGIGGDSASSPSSITINGGDVTAIGGDDIEPLCFWPANGWPAYGNYAGYASGIGCGGFAWYTQGFGALTINGGTITAQVGEQPSNCGKNWAIYMSNNQSDVLYGRSLYVGTDAASATVGTYYYAIDSMPYARFEPTLDPVDFLIWDSSAKKFIEARKQTYTVVTKDTTTFQDGGWYVVEDDVSCGTITVEGAAHLILKDGKKMTVNGADETSGIIIAEGASLTTYAQSARTGKLEVHGGGRAQTIRGKGTLNVNGGNVIAEGAFLTQAISCKVILGSAQAVLAGHNASSAYEYSAENFQQNSQSYICAYVQIPYEAYTVTYDGNGADGTMAVAAYGIGKEFVITSGLYTMVGYDFMGWTNKDTGAFYAAGSTVKDLAAAGEKITLVANWKARPEGEKVTSFSWLESALLRAPRQSAKYPVKITITSGVKLSDGDTVTIPTGSDVPKIDIVYEDNGTKMWLENGVLYATPFNSTVPTDAIVLIIASNGGNIPSAFKIRSKVEGKTVDSDVRVLVGSDGFSYDSLKDMMGASKRPATVTLRNALNIPEDYGLKEELTSQTTPGTILKNNTIYTVKGHVLINAKANAGQSALKVPVGSAAILEIPAGCSLTVIGGDAEEQLGAGAGIEVPMGAKLIVCGEGKLTAIGGSAAPGERGHKGLAGEVTPLLDLNTFPFEELEKGDIGIGDAFGLMFGKGTLSKAIDSILLVGKGGTGGAGGFGGGGAAAGIGGKGGRGGNGGAETVGRRVVPGSQWGKHQEQYESWFETLGWEYPQTYGYATWNQHAGNRTLDGATGSRGEQGGSGMASGEIIIAENVRVAAYPGEAAAGGLSGTCGKSFSIYDLDHDNTQIMDFVVMGVQVAVDIAVTVMTGGGNKAAEGAHEAAKDKDDEDDDDDDDDEDDDTSQKLWFYGGGGGAGGAGGAAALQGIGPGGAGGGGGGAGGSGLFIIGSNLADEDNEELGLEANGHGGLGGEAYIPDSANAEEIRAKCFGQDANVINGGESAGQEPQKSTNPEAECFNLYTNAAAKAFWAQAGLPERKRLGCWTTNIDNDGVVGGDLTADCFAYAGLPGLGGKAGNVKTDYTIYLANSAKVVAGLDASKKRDYPGKVFCKLTLVLNNGQPNTEDWYACGTAIAPCRIPSGSKVFAGYFTKPDGKGIEYFDKFGNPASFPFITSDMTLYAHWVDSDVDLGIRNCITHEGGSFTNACVTFQTGYVHYFTDDAEYGNSELSIPGARISGNAGETAIFYIPEGVEVEFTGGDGDGTEPGYPGIEVPAGLNLVITGGGTLVATGGSAGSPTEGAQGEAGYYKFSIDSVISGGGGAGGNGAGGAAPAIGGCGGKGGEGASGVPGDTVYCDGKRSCISGNNGPSGSSGGAGTSCGNVVIVGSLSVILEGGEGVEGAAGGKTGGSGDDDGSKNAQNYTATGGGGGGGGGGSASALTIGGGIGGGGGGGSGGSGSTMNNDIEDAISAGAGPGQGGFGGKTCEDAANGGNGEAPNVSTYTGEGNYSRSGYGGAAGAAGQAGSNGTYSRGLNLNVTAPDSGDREKLGDTDYVFGHPTLQRTITFTFRGQKVGTILAMVGEALPSVIVDQLEEVYGFEFAGAYLVDEKGEPVLNELGLEDWWYDEYGYGEKKYDVMGDVTLEVHFEPKWEKAADWPEMVDFVYDGNEHRVLETIDADAGFTVRSGTLSATDVGVYSVELQLKDGYEVWSDAETVEIDVATNAVRTWKWVIRPAEVDAKFENQAYDWTNPTNAFVGVEGKIPAGMQTGYEIKNLYASGVYEVEATVSYPAGSTGNNYLPKVMNAVCTVPFAVNLKTVRPFGGRRAAFDFTLDEKSAESVLNSYSNLTVCAAIATNGSVDLSNTNAVHVLATVPVSETHLGYGTLVVDFGAAFPDYHGSVWTWFAIDGVPASAVNVVDVETAGAAEDALRLAPNVRYSVTEKGTNIVFMVMDTVADKRYRIDYKAAKTDDWTEGEPVDGKNGVTEIAAPYQGETGFYRPREVKSEK